MGLTGPRPRQESALAHPTSAPPAELKSTVAPPPEIAEVRVDERTQARFDDDWPNTNRLLPWALAAFLAMLCLVPFDRVKFGVPTPIDATLDRVVLVPFALVWLMAMLVGAHRSRARLSTPFTLSVMLFLGAVALSIVLNLPRLTQAYEITTSIKSLALLGSYLIFLVMVVTIVRPGEVHRFATLFVVLASIASLGTVYEYRVRVNEFYAFAETFLGPFASIGSPPVASEFERFLSVGPTSHGLAMVVLATLALPFAIVGLMERRLSEYRGILLMAATALLLAGAMATLRRTAGIMPLAALAVLFALRPRSMLRLLPFGLVVVLVLQAVTPGALGSINRMLTGGTLQQQQSVASRTSDYDAVGPDVWDKPLFGRGFGSYDARSFRYLDNQYLGLAISTGFTGLLAFIGMFLGLVVTCWRAIRAGPTSPWGSIAVAAVSGAAAFFVSSFTFDVLAFPQAPYLFFFSSGLALVAVQAHRSEHGRERQPADRLST